MKRNTGTWTRTRRAVFGAALCACFVFQQLLIPIHLAENDHVYRGEHGQVVDHALARTGHTHGGDRHSHHHDAPAPTGSQEEHEPHSAEEHQVLLGVPEVSQAPSAPAIALVPLGIPALVFDELTLGQPEDAELCPRPPPPRSAAAPRAPPIVT